MFNSLPYAEQAIQIHAEDADTVTSSGANGSINIRHGRLRLFNSFGSDKADLSLPLQAEGEAALESDATVERIEVTISNAPVAVGSVGTEDARGDDGSGIGEAEEVFKGYSAFRLASCYGVHIYT